MKEPNIELEQKLMTRAAAVLREVGMPTAADTVVLYSKMGKVREYVELAIESGIAGEREKLEMEYTIKLATARMRDRIEYKIMSEAFWLSGMTTQGYRTFWG